MAREILHHEKFIAKKIRDAEDEKQMKRDKLLAQDEALRLHAQKVSNEEREKQNRLQREIAMVQNLEYIKKKREFILSKSETNLQQKRLMKEQRDHEQNERIRLANEYKEKQKALKKEETEQRIAKAQEDAKKLADERRKQLELKVAENEEKREKIRKELQEKFEASLGDSEQISRDKMMKIRQDTEQMTNERVLGVKNTVIVWVLHLISIILYLGNENTIGHGVQRVSY